MELLGLLLLLWGHRLRGAVTSAQTPGPLWNVSAAELYTEETHGAEEASAGWGQAEGAAPRERSAPQLPRAQGRVSSSGGGLPHCTCDLAPGACDLNCCCDPACGLQDPLAVFSHCLPGSTRAVSLACVESTLLFRNNSLLAASTAGTAPSSQICLQLNDSSLNFFSDPRNVSTADFPGLAAQYGGPSFIQPDQAGPPSASFYQAGAPILTLGSSSTLGVLRQPVALGQSTACIGLNPAGFLLSQPSTCTRTFTNLASSCESDPALSAASYYKPFTLLRAPSLANGSVSPQVAITSSSTPASPSLLNGSCINVVSQVRYLIHYNGTSGIQAASISFSLANTSTDPGSSLAQSFSLSFSPSSQADQGNMPLSGSPGYIDGAPLMTSVSGARQPVTLMQSRGDGTCSEQARTSALFRVNMRAGCRFSNVASNSCAGFAEQLKKTLMGAEPPQTLAIFGNANPSAPADWSSILYQNCSGPQGDCSTGCLVPVSLEIQVLWAKVGLRSNPQAQVLGARYQSHCSLLKCQSPVALETVLSFIDTTLYPELPRGQDALDWKLPFDFFFPFRVVQSGGSVLGRDLSDVLLFNMAALTFQMILKL
ncbi:tectonic-3 [Ambystoma mexicanum]|uniref:tectonic-3 n=1 Tax=Ambystoma mexicanum TaxID=8296 RepID=UPI0037E7C306